jgi:anti-anti-sigma factor
MDALVVEVSIREGCQVVKISGDLDADTVPRLDFHLDRLANLMPVIIDLADVRAVTSAGVQALLRERSFGVPTLLTPAGTTVSRVLEIVQAHRLVPIYSDLAAALVGSHPRLARPEPSC